MQIKLTLGFGVSERDVAVTAPVGTSFAQIRSALGFRSEPDEPVFSRSIQLGSDVELGAPGLRSGDRLTVEKGDGLGGELRAMLRVHVVGGVDSGLIEPLVRGRLTIGRDEDCELSLTDPDVSRRHVVVEVTAKTVQVSDLSSTNGAMLDGVALGSGSHDWPIGGMVRLGSTVLTLVDTGDIPASLRTAQGTRLVNRASRQLADSDAEVIQMPGVPGANAAAKLQLLAATLPAVGGGVLALVMHNAQLLLFALLTPLMMIGTALGDRVTGRRSRRREVARYRTRKRDADAEVDRALDLEARRRRTEHPDPAAIMRTASLPDHRLWERRRRDPDHLDIRLGLTVAPSRLQIAAGEDCQSAGMLTDIPHAVSLRRGPAGLCGPRQVIVATVRWALCQLATLQSPTDLDFVFLLSEDSAKDWSWIRWLPHAVVVGHSAADQRATALSLQRMLTERQAPASGWSGPWTVIVMDRSGGLLELPGLSDVLERGPTVGITAICFDDQLTQLPTGCATTVHVSGETGALLQVSSDSGSTNSVLGDQASVEWAERLARNLAPMRDAAGADATSIPDSCRLLDVIELDEPNPEAIVGRWRQSRGPITAIGRTRDGAIELDLVRDGPHMLVAGTTGSGKSEFLQTLISGLALANSPADLAFVLIDYKGGAAFSECARLPHTAGLVTDLDAQLTARALKSLEAELRRRETLFAQADASDLDIYRVTEQHRSDPLGRLVLVVDEFASLAEELPDFVPGLVGIAQRGRSLGVHLVLATQRPGGVVSPEIKANASLRVALRTTGPAESMEIVGVEAAARILKTTPGRALIRTGSTLTEVQTAYAGAPSELGQPDIVVTPLNDWGVPLHNLTAEDAGRTDLTMLVDAIRAAAVMAGLGQAPRPWLPPLASAIRLTEDLPGDATTDSTTYRGRLAIGLVDEPAEQRQVPLRFDVDAGGTTLVVGGPRTGRTTLLRTIAAAAATSLDPSRLHIYGLDCAGGALSAVGLLPHCGAIVMREQGASVARVIERLDQEVRHRHAALTRLGAGSTIEANLAGADLPAIVVLIDGWEGITATSDAHDAGQSIETLLNIVRESSSVGISVVITGGRAALTSRLAGLVSHKFVLRLADPGDYAFAGISARASPGALPPGRALRLPDADHVQFAHCGVAPSTQEQTRAMEVIAGRHPSIPASLGGPWQLTALPDRVQLQSLLPVAAELTALGIGGDGGESVSVDLFAGEAHWLVGGPPRSGRTNLLLCILSQALHHARPILVAAPRRSALAAAATDNGIRLVTPGADIEWVHAQASNSQLILIDDVEEFADTPAGDALTERLRSADHGSVAIVVAGRTEELALAYRGLTSILKRSRTGILLQPGPGDADLFGLRLARSRAQPIAGRGLLVSDQVAGGSLPIQIGLVP